MLSKDFDIELDEFSNPFSQKKLRQSEDYLFRHWLEEVEVQRDPKKIDGELKVVNFEQLYDLNESAYISCCAKKNNLIKDSNELSTKFPTSLSNDEFIKFLDSDFKAEINLSDDVIDRLFTKEKVKELKIKDPEVNLAYRGQKNLHQRGKHAHRIDILFKNFIRSTRRYLCEMFSKEFDIEQINDDCIYTEKVIEFYSKFFKPFESSELSNCEDTQSNILFVLGMVISSSHKFVSRDKENVKLCNLFNSIYKCFSKEKCLKLCSYKQIREIFSMLRESGIINKMICAYPILSNSKEEHQEIANSIIENRVAQALRK